ncbi:cis-prenyltransferase [Ordospora colligata]
MNIAFICDGNRRYMKKHGFKDPFERDDGLNKIYEFIQFAYIYGIREVSLFCFAIKNFRRKSSEVDGIMNIITNKFKTPEEKEIRIKAKIRIYGRLDLVKQDVRDKLILIQNETQHNQDIIVNIFFAYSAEDEIIQGVKFNSNVDILIRTGNEKRLSDFMIRQVAQGTSVFFAKPLWPEMSTIHLFLILLKHKLEDRYLS